VSRIDIHDRQEIVVLRVERAASVGQVDIVLCKQRIVDWDVPPVTGQRERAKVLLAPLVGQSSPTPGAPTRGLRHYGAMAARGWRRAAVLALQSAVQNCVQLRRQAQEYSTAAGGDGLWFSIIRLS
jgi:hypothetical protein